MARHITDASGNYRFPLEKEREYRLQAEKENYFKQSVGVNTRTATSPVIRNDFRLFPLKVNQVVRLYNIFYDYNKWDIRPDAAIELDKLVQTLTDNPTVAIELSSPTDASGKYRFPLEKEREYRLQAEKENYFKQSVRVNTRTATLVSLTDRKAAANSAFAI